MTPAWRRPWLWAGIVGIAHAVVAGLLALRLHPVEVPGGESDGYVYMVEHLLAGRPCYDGYHGVHTALLGGLVGWLTGVEAFTALRLSAACAGAVIVVATWSLARSLGGPRPAWLALLVAVVHGGLLVHAMQAASDVFAAAFVAIALAAAARVGHGGGRAAVLTMGVGFGLALGTRASTVALAPLLLVSFGVPAWRRTAGLAGAGVLLGWLPHALVVWHERGSPFFGENWRSIALKHGGFESRLLDEPQSGSLTEFLLAHGEDVLAMGLADLGQQLGGGAGRFLIGGGPLPAAVVAGLVVVLAGARLLWSSRSGLLLVGSCACYLVAICLTFAPIDRLLLPVLGPAFAILASAGASRRRWVAATGVLSCVAFAVVSACRLPGCLDAFVAAHPLAEIEAARLVVADPDVHLPASTWSMMARHAGGRVAMIDLPAHGSLRGVDDALAHLQAVQRRTGANGMVVGRRTAGPLHAQLQPGQLPAAIRVLRSDADVVVLRLPARVVDDTGAATWFDAVTVTPTQGRRGAFTVTARLHTGVAAARIVRAWVAVRPPIGKPIPIDLRATAAGEFGTALESPPPGVWPVQAWLALDDGSIVRGPERLVTVPPG